MAMADDRRCSSCQFASLAYFDANDDDAPVIYECRRYPPAIKKKHDKIGFFPFVEETDWCGEFDRADKP